MFLSRDIHGLGIFMAEPKKETLHSDDLVIPVYIDTTRLLDLIASIENGFSYLEKVTTRNTKTKNSELSGQAEASVDGGAFPEFLNFLKIKLGATGIKKTDTGEDNSSETERYHTHGSLLKRLRKHLETNKLLKFFDGSEESWNDIGPMSFVELRGVIKVNPLQEYFTAMEELLDFHKLIQNLIKIPLQNNVPDSRQPQSQGRRSNQSDDYESKEIKQFRGITKKVLEEFSKRKEPRMVFDLLHSTDHKAVFSINPSFLGDNSLVDLADNEYLILGKVARKLYDADDVPINLLPGITLARLGVQNLNQLTEMLNKVTETGIDLPEIRTEIGSPALEILPIAIYI